METLGAVLRRQQPREESAELEPGLEDLQRLSATAELAADVARRRRVLDRVAPGAAHLRGRLERELAIEERRLGWAHRRDALRAARPAGCWCLGFGGRGRTAIAVDSEVWGRADYCVCPEAAAVREAVRAERARLDREWRRDRLARLWEIADLPPHYAGCTLDSYPVTDRTRAAVARVREWLGVGQWLYLWGPLGTGKTGLAFGLMRVLAERDRPVIFTTVPDLLARIRATWNQREQRQDTEREAAILRSLSEVDVLILDDWGAEPPAKDWADDIFYRLINARLGQDRQTIVTSNHDPDGLAGHLGGGVAGGRIVWRVVEATKRGPDDPRPYIVHLDGPNLRDVWPVGA